jgi:hypothetical protein
MSISDLILLIGELKEFFPCPIVYGDVGELGGVDG